MGVQRALDNKAIDRIEKVLDELIGKTRATYVLLTDVSGQLVSSRGRTGSTKVVELAALAASNLAATSEMARLIGEERPFHLLFHEGDKSNIYLSQVADSFLLAVVFSTTVQIGLVRLFSKRATDELATLSAAYETSLESLGSAMEEGFAKGLDDELDRLLSG